MKKRFLWTGLLILLIGSAQAAEVYRWVDKSGKVHYGETPEQEAVQVERKKFGAPSATESAGLSYETARASENFPVTLYVSDNCSDFCKQARDFLIKRGIPFAEKNLVAGEDAEAFKQASGGDVVPTLSVGKTWLKGFLTTQWNSELDIAGYPKTSPYRPAAPAKPAENGAGAEKPVTEK